jgi:mutator protein MutT
MSNAERFTIRAAVYLLLVKDGKVLLLRRFNTGWRNGEYTLPAGHVDGGESIRSELCREAKEEIGITIKPSDLQFTHVMHQQDNHEYIDFYFVAKTWNGEPTNCEPEKCDDLRWVPLNGLPDNVIPNVKQALIAYAAHEGYSEFGWN